MMRLASMNAGMAYDVFGWSYYYGFGYFAAPVMSPVPFPDKIFPE